MISRYKPYISCFLLASPEAKKRVAIGVAGLTVFLASIGPASAQTSNAVAVHPERGGLLLETEEQRYVAPKRPGQNIPFIDPRLSIFVTDKNTMKQITFAEVMQQLVDQSGDRMLTAKQLYNTWWDSADAKPKDGGKPEVSNALHHCNDEGQPDPTRRLAPLNGFPYRCPRPEREQATEDPFDPIKDQGYIPIAYSNRFDLADPTGRDCGEYRLVFARVSGADTGDPRDAGGDRHAGNPINRNLIIFEARVKNPAPPIVLATDPSKMAENPNSMANLKGCRPIIDAWSRLSDSKMSTTERGKVLHDLYLKGIPEAGVGPIISVENYKGDGQGQIRTNQFIDHGALDLTDVAQQKQFDWTLREFKIVRTPTGPNGSTSVQIVPQTVKSNPGTTLFDVSTTDSRAAEFADHVVGQLGPLRGGQGGEGNIDTFSYNNPDKFNSFESDESKDNAISFGDKLGSAFSQFESQRGPLFGRLKQALEDDGSKLTPSQVVARLQTQTCSGCHRYSNKNLNGAASNPANDLGQGLNWTQSLGFTQESERDFEGGPDGNASRFLISDLLKDIFLPARLDNIRRFLAEQ